MRNAIKSLDEIQVRDKEEIQKAHDLLLALIVEELPPEILKAIRDAGHGGTVRVMASVLCWVLNHDNNSDFPDILNLLETALFELGVVITKAT